jgi:uncharacterized membrane protein SpoIIM required for sporulation
MNRAELAADRRDAWNELAELTTRAEGKGGRGRRRLDAAAVLRLGELYRAAVADLALARRRFPGDPLTAGLEQLVQRARAAVHAHTRSRQSARWFLTTGFWRRVRECPAEIGVAALLLFGSALGLGLWSHQDPVTAARVQPTLARSAAQRGVPADRGFSNADSATISSQIFTNNMRVALLAFAGGLTLGLLTVYMLITNGLILGLLGGLSVAGGTWSRFVQLIVPHGLLEQSLNVVAGAAGLRVADAIVHPGHERRLDALVREGRAAIEMAVGAALCLIPCGLVEGFVTPRGIGYWPAIGVGVALAGLFWGLVLWRGRPA